MLLEALSELVVVVGDTVVVVILAIVGDTVLSGACRSSSRLVSCILRSLLSPRSCDHFLERKSVIVVFCLLLFSDASTFRALFIHTSAGEGLSITAIVNEDWPIVEVLQVGQLCDDGLPVVPNLTGKTVVLEVQHFEVGHVAEDFINDLRFLNPIVLQIERCDGRTLKQTAQVIKAVTANPVTRQVEHVEALTASEALNCGDHVIGEVQISELDQVI